MMDNDEGTIADTKYLSADQCNEVILKMGDDCDNTADVINPPIAFTNEEGQTILVTLEDSMISDQEISIRDSDVTESKSMRGDVLLVSTGNTTESSVGLMTTGGCSTGDDKEHISQNWFTSKTDKQSLQEQGHRWKQGQWTTEENELLKHNINSYCEEKGINDPNLIIFDMTKDMRKDFYRAIARGLDRPLFSVYRRVLRMYDQKNHIGKYTPDEIVRLRNLRELHGNDWATIGAALGRSAGSVRDRCRLMKDSCRYGTWQHEEEMRLATAVYELSGAQPGQEVHHGLCWADVSSKVKTRTDKQCRAKWLNFLNWKQKGGAEWSGPADDYLLLEKIINTGVTDESKIDWIELSKGWSCVRSPQWLRSKWWSLKRVVTNYQTLPFTEILATLTMLTATVRRIRAPATAVSSSECDTTVSCINALTGGSENSSKLTTASGATTFRLCSSAEGYKLTPTIQLPDGTRAVLSDDISLESNSLFITSAPHTNTFLIANPNDTISFPLSSMNEPLIVQALPLGDETSVKAEEIVPSSLADEVPPTQNSEDDIIYTLTDTVTDTSTHTHDTILVSNFVEPSKSSLHHLSSTSDPLLNSQSADLNHDN